MITLHACVACGLSVFPARKLCHRCGGAVWERVPCAQGVIDGVTIVHQSQAVVLACVRTPQEVRVIVRLEHAMAPGARVALREADDGALWARPVGVN